MERDQTLSSLDFNKRSDPENVNVVEWEDFEQELARFWSLSSALREAKQKKQSLQQRLESLIQVEAESLSRSNELELMRQKMEVRKIVLMNTSTRTKLAADKSKKQEECVRNEVRSLLVAVTVLSVARKRLQELNQLLMGEKGYDRLMKFQKKLRVRQQHMMSQVSLVYLVKISVGPAQEQELESFPSTSRSGHSAGSKAVNHGSLTILGLPLTMLPFKTISFFTDKKEVQRSATALGYVAHAVTLTASYLKVHLRYPLRMAGSQSYILDYASSVEPTSSNSLSTKPLSRNMKHAEFPLFLKGQDKTKAAYAVFLLNKDLEQLLNFIGVKSLGPSQVLPNLKELLRIIQSANYIYT